MDIYTYIYITYIYIWIYIYHERLLRKEDMVLEVRINVGKTARKVA